MKQYLIGWFYIAMENEGNPDISDGFIVDAIDQKDAIRQFPKNVGIKGYGCPKVYGEIINEELKIFDIPGFDFKNTLYYDNVNKLYKVAKKIPYVKKSIIEKFLNYII